MRQIALLGAGGHGKVVAEIIQARGGSPVFFDERYSRVQSIGSHTVQGTLQDYAKLASAEFPIVVSIGDNDMRADFYRRCNHVAAALVHPTAYVAPSVRLGQGTVVMAGAIINADTEIGQGVIINSGALIEHDCKIGDFAHVSPGVMLAGYVTVGNFAWVGIGSCARDRVQIGERAVIGAGSVIVTDIAPNITAFGNPCKPR